MLIFIVVVTVVLLVLFVVVVGTESGPVKFEFEFALMRIVVELLEVDELVEELFDEEFEEDDDEFEDVVGKVKGPSAPPAVRRVPAFEGVVLAADPIEGVVNKEATTIETKEKIRRDFFLRLIDTFI